MSPVLIAVLIYGACVCLTGFFVALSDKRRAKAGAWRIREKTFLLLSLLGGGIGVLAGFFLFRHKTKHAGLMLGVITLTAVFYGVAIYMAIR